MPGSNLYDQNRLERDFYSQDGLTVARALPGKILVRRLNQKKIYCRIVETEAYLGPEDKASHAYMNKRTQRTEPMFHNGGTVYIYLIYGMYHCFNIVCNSPGIPHAVLIRAVEPIDGEEYCIREKNSERKLTNGPGKLCRALGITMDQKGLDLTNSDELYIIPGTDDSFTISASSRINIDYAGEFKNKLWRFTMTGNLYLSR